MAKAEPTQGWTAFEQACEELHAAAVKAARLAKRQLDSGGPVLPAAAAELDAALQRATACCAVARARMRALGDAQHRRVWSDFRPSVQARIRWEAEHVPTMYYAACVPITALAETAVGLAPTFPAADGASSAGGKSRG